jgi:hypothetical protein
MNSKRLLQQAFGLTLGMLLLAGCGGAPVAPTSTSTPTPVPPTETPVPPTETPMPIPPTAIQPVVPVATLTGRLLFADSEKPVADTSVYITGEAGSMSFASGILVNPTGKTDSTGRFKIEIPEAFLMEQDYQIMVLVGFEPNLVPLKNQDGAYAVFQIESVPSENDLGDVLVQR